MFDLAKGLFGGRDTVDNVLPLRSKEQQPFFSLGKLVNSKHIDRAKAFEPLAQIVRPLTGIIKLEFVGDFLRRNQLTKRNIQFLRAVFVDVFEVRDGFGLANLDRGTLVHCVGGTAVKFGKLFGRCVRFLTGERHGGERRFQLVLLSNNRCFDAADRRGNAFNGRTQLGDSRIGFRYFGLKISGPENEFFNLDLDPLKRGLHRTPTFARGRGKRTFFIENCVVRIRLFSGFRQTESDPVKTFLGGSASTFRTRAALPCLKNFRFDLRDLGPNLVAFFTNNAAMAFRPLDFLFYCFC
jgi:hypothetical protein